MIRKNKQIKASNLKMEKNIDEVIKFFELEENIKQFLNKAILKQKRYTPDLNELAKEIVNKEIIKCLKPEILQELLKNIVENVVSNIAYEIFIKKMNELKEEYQEKISEI